MKQLAIEILVLAAIFGALALFSMSYGAPDTSSNNATFKRIGDSNFR